MRWMINALLEASGIAPVEDSIPFPVAYALGALCEGVWTLLRRSGEPPMTRFLAEQLSTTHWYSMDPAQRDFGYRPKISIADGLRQLRAHR